MAVLGALRAAMSPRIKSVPITIILGFVGGTFVGVVGWFTNTNKGKKLKDNMSKKQKICLWIGVAAFALMCIFPPAGRIYVKNTLAETILYVSILLIRWVVVIVVTGSLIYILRDKKPKTSKNNK